MTAAPLRPRLGTETLIGTFINLDAPAVVETMGAAGYDYLVLDAEHSPFSIDRVADLLRGASAVGVPALVRVPEAGPWIGRVLDAGAAGVLVPRIETAAAAAEVVGRARYAPLGARGLGPGRGGYLTGGVAEHVRAANDGILVAVQIETRQGLEAADQILAVPGIDAVVVGPADLAASLGVELGSAPHRAASDQVLDLAAKHGVAPGAYTPDVAGARALAVRGARLIIVGGDGFLLARAAREEWAQLLGVKDLIHP